jgi:hypothetical protein
MPKFSALSLADLRTPERSAARILRNVCAVVAVEADDGSWFELDATCTSHAAALADNQVDKMSARGASCWDVSPKTGKLVHNFYQTFWHPEEVA